MVSSHAGIEAESQGDQGRRGNQRNFDPDCPPGEPFPHAAGASVHALLVAQLPVANLDVSPGRNTEVVTFRSETLNFERDMFQSVITMVALDPERGSPTLDRAQHHGSRRPDQVRARPSLTSWSPRDRPPRITTRSLRPNRSSSRSPIVRSSKGPALSSSTKR